MQSNRPCHPAAAARRSKRIPGGGTLALCPPTRSTLRRACWTLPRSCARGRRTPTASRSGRSTTTRGRRAPGAHADRPGRRRRAGVARSAPAAGARRGREGRRSSAPPTRARLQRTPPDRRCHRASTACTTSRFAIEIWLCRASLPSCSSPSRAIRGGGRGRRCRPAGRHARRADHECGRRAGCAALGMVWVDVRCHR
jgi:hypothetical protein